MKYSIHKRSLIRLSAQPLELDTVAHPTRPHLFRSGQTRSEADRRSAANDRLPKANQSLTFGGLISLVQQFVKSPGADESLGEC